MELIRYLGGLYSKQDKDKLRDDLKYLVYYTLLWIAYIDLFKKKDDLLKLELLSRPILRDILSTATSIAKLDLNQLTAYNQLYAKYKNGLYIH